MNKTFLEKLLSGITGILTYIFGGLDSLFFTLLIFIIIDYITGICKGIYKHELSSSTSIKGIIKKFGYILIVIVASFFDNIINDSSMAIRNLVIYFFIANEAISILENWAIMELPLPKKLFYVFEKIKEEK